MRLKEPLMGLSIMQGHLVVHLSMFIGSMAIATDRWRKTIDLSKLTKEALDLQILTEVSLYKLRWLHLISAILITASIFLKFNNLHNWAAITSIVQPILYIFSVIFITQRVQNITYEKELKGVETNEWMAVEN